MKMELKRTVKKEVEEIVEVELKKYWRIRLTPSQSVIDKEYDHKPTEQEIGELLLRCCDRDCFATVFEHYKVVDVLDGSKGE